MAISRSTNGQFRSMGRVITHLTVLILLGVLVGIVNTFGKPPHRGFFCDDDSIRYPVHSDTVPSTLLFTVCILVPIVVFVVVEVCHVYVTCSSNDTCYTLSTGLLFRLWELFGSFLLGCGMEELSTDIGKITIGRLRPHFLTVCDLQKDVCSNLSDPHTYMTDYECKVDSKQARLSFPSGHSALSFYTAMYLVIYLHYRLRLSILSVPSYVFQAALLIVAYFTALSRVADYMHHPADVAAGALLGCFWAVLTTRVLVMRTTSRHRYDNGLDQGV